MTAINRRSLALALAVLAAVWMVASGSVQQSFAYDVAPVEVEAPAEVAAP